MKYFYRVLIIPIHLSIASTWLIGAILENFATIFTGKEYGFISDGLWNKASVVLDYVASKGKIVRK